MQKTRIRVALLALLSLLPVTVLAQLQVDEFKLLETDLTANTRGTMEYDQNGEVAALIKIVTPEQGFNFEGGSLGIVRTKQKKGEIWLYVPRHAQRLTIQHERFGVLREYVYPITIEGGRTYELLLNIGGGRYVNISSTGASRPSVSVDGEYVGEAPLHNIFMPFGERHVTAAVEHYEADTTFVVTEGGGVLNLNMTMHDMTDYFGDVEVTVDGNADIYFQGRLCGKGRWQTNLREGNYSVVTRKEACDSSVTHFTVEPRRKNRVTATAPVPHTGRLQVFTRPRNVISTLGGRNVDFSEPLVLNVGSHHLAFNRKGFVMKEQEYRILRNELTVDTVTLNPINYLKGDLWAFYFGAGYTLSSLSGLTGYIGSVFRNIDIQLSYTLGLSSSKTAYWYQAGDAGHELLAANRYKMSAMAARLGYQWRLIPRLGITPQVGVLYQRLAASLNEGSGKYADGAAATSLTLGARVTAVPAHRIYLFLTPEYAVPFSKDATFTKVADAADFNAGGLSVSVGVLVNFGK